MRRFMVAAAVLGLVAAPASAQMGGKRHGGDGPVKSSSGPKIDEKAYKAALDRIPEPKEKYDPWSGSRPTEPEKKK